MPPTAWDRLLALANVREPGFAASVPQHGQSAVWAVLQRGSCASSGRAWRLWAARCFKGEASPLSARSLPLALQVPETACNLSSRLEREVRCCYVET